MDKCKTRLGYNVVPPPYTGNFMPLKSDLVYPSLDDFVHVNKSVSESVVEKPTDESNEPKTPRKENGALIIEDWVSESEEDDEPKFQTSGLISLNAARLVNTVQPRTSVNNAEPMKNIINNAYSTARRPFNKITTTNNNNFNKRVNTINDKNVNAARPNAVVNTARPKAVLSAVKGNKGNAVKASACWVWRPKHKVLDHVSRNNGVSMSFKRFDYGNPHQDLKDKGVIESGCSRHMTRNRSYLTDYEEIDGGFVAFGGNSKGGKITGNGKIRTGKLDFEDVYFVKELKFNLFSVSQMYDKKNSVLFTDTACIVLSPDFKLTDESHVLLKVPRKDNIVTLHVVGAKKSFYNSSYKKFGPWWSYLMKKELLGLNGFSGTRRMKEALIEAIRLFLAYASFKDFVVYQMDFKSAFIFGVRLKRKSMWSTTGLKIQTSRQVAKRKDRQDFVYQRDKSDIMLVQVYVDDIIFGSTRKKMCTEFEKMMHKKFQMSSMGELTFFLVNPKVSHLHDVKKIFRYLKGQPKLGLWYPKDSPFDLVAYTDSDYAGASLDRKSTIGAEYIAASNSARDRVNLQVKNPVFHQRQSTLNYAINFINISNEKKLNQMIKMHTEQNVADFAHKALDVSRFQYADASIESITSEQFWTTAKVKTVNGEVQIQALVDKKKVIITETRVRSDLQLEDAEAFFSPQWKFLIHIILQCLSAKTTAWNEFSSTMASAVICLATNKKFNFSKYIFDNMVKNLEGGVKFLMYLRQGKDFSGRDTPLFLTMIVQAQEQVGEGSEIPTDSHHTVGI
ncbi:ribonuclease H-like domain-containing protein [Tanacetum coccineum]